MAMGSLSACATAQKTSGASGHPETPTTAQLPDGIEFEREWAHPGRSYQSTDPRARMCVASTRPVYRGAGAFYLANIEETARDLVEIMAMMSALSEHLPAAAAFVAADQPWPPVGSDIDSLAPARLWRGQPAIPVFGDLPSGGTLLIPDVASPGDLRLAEWWVGASERLATSFTGSARLDPAAGSIHFAGHLALVPMQGRSFEGVQFTGGLQVDATVTRQDGSIQLEGSFFLAASKETLSVEASWAPQAHCESLDNGLHSARATADGSTITLLPGGEDCDGIVTWAFDGDRPDEFQLQSR